MEEELLLSYGIAPGLYRNGSIVVNVMCLGCELSDPNSRFVVCSRPGMAGTWLVSVEEFCAAFIRVMGRPI